MKNFLRLCVFLWMGPALIYGQYIIEEGARFKPELGIWFGPVTPVPGSSLSTVLDTNLGGGIFFRANIPSNELRFEMGASFSYYNSEGTERLGSLPIYGGFAYKLPLNLPIALQVKLGGGSNYFYNEPEGNTNWLPILMTGGELSFPAGRWVNIGIRADYYWAMERFITPSESYEGMSRSDGHFLNFGLMVNFNW